MNYLEILAFLSIAFVQTGSPGPSTLLVINNAINYGYKKSIIVLSGDLIATGIIGILASLGVHILLKEYPLVLPIVQLFGGSYLMYLGIKVWRKSNNITPKYNKSNETIRNIWYKSFIVSISNPKAIIFFSAFFPIFISDTHNSYQIYVLLFMFLITKLIILGSYAVLTHMFSGQILRFTNINMINKVSSMIFCIFGTWVIINSLQNL